MGENIGKPQAPVIPLVSVDSTNNVGYRDTLNRVGEVLELLNELDLSEGLSPNAETGIYWVQLMLIDSIRYVSDSLAVNQSK